VLRGRIQTRPSPSRTGTPRQTLTPCSVFDDCPTGWLYDDESLGLANNKCTCTCRGSLDRTRLDCDVIFRPLYASELVRRQQCLAGREQMGPYSECTVGLQFACLVGLFVLGWRCRSNHELCIEPNRYVYSDDDAN